MTVSQETQRLTASIDHTFISYARYDSAFVMEIAGGLRARGVPIWIDQWDIEPAANWTASIDVALNACGKMLIVLSPEAVASDEVLTELRAAHNGRKRIVPLLHRPCEIPTRLSRTQYLDWSRSTDVSAAALDELADLLQKPQTPDLPPPDRDASGRRTLLDDVRAEARDRLQSLGTETPIVILLERQRHQVERPWDGELVAAASPRPTPLADDILDVFDDAAVDGNLLILGAPGSGKTTTLVQLLQHLAERADPKAGNEPIPVLLSLASWNAKKSFDDWLVDELHVKYGVRRDVGRRWRDDGLLIPLLDGLDEVTANDQHACVEAINAFQAAHRPRHLVVCCRRAEYEQLTVKLRLHDAVCLQPLAAAQIRTYLDRAGASNVWNAIESDPKLLQMACSPLLLSFISSMASEQERARAPDGASVEERRWRLFERYLSTRLAAGASRPAYSPQQTMRCLQQLATILKRKGISEFLIERMQPDWLHSRAERWSYSVGVVIVSTATVFLVQQSLLLLFDLVPQGNIGLALQRSQLWKAATHDSPIARTLPVLVPLIFGCVVALRKTIVPIETLTWSWTRAATNARLWARKAAVAGVEYGITVGVLIAVVGFLATFKPGGPGVTVWQTAGQIVGCAGAMFAAVLLARLKTRAWVTAPRQSVPRKRLLDALIAASVYAVVTGAMLSWVVGVLAGMPVFAIVGFSAASNDRDRLALLRWPLAAGLSSAFVGAATSVVLSLSMSRLGWVLTWVNGGLAVGMIAGVVAAVFNMVRDLRQTTLPYPPTETNPAWKRFGLTTVLVAGALSIVAVVTARVSGPAPIRDVLLLVWFTQAGFAMALLYLGFGALCAAIGGAPMAAVLGALAGVLSGATGADVERRLVPNQGIRQSAINVGIFAALGALIVGQLYGVLNLSAAAAATRTLPSAADWLRLGVGAGVNLGVLAGLLPGAACIQHFTLRFVLWAGGAAPWRFIRFLHFATERRVLQQVGGRYRFIHVSLRDHLAETRWHASRAETESA